MRRRSGSSTMVIGVLAVVTLASAAGCGGTPAATPGDAAPAASGPTTTVAPAGPRPSAGCQASALPPDGKVTVTAADGTERWYLRHTPAGVPAGEPVPLVVDLHGYAEGAELQATISGFGPLGDQEGFATVTPHGSGTPVHWDARLDSPDMDYLGQVLDDAGATLCLDLDRVYMAGYSNGAFTTSSVVCRYADRVAAVGAVAGLRDVPGCQPARSVPIVAFHGDQDDFVRYEGGMGSKAAALPAPDGSGLTVGENPDVNSAIAPGSMDQAVPDILRAWAQRNGCQPTPTETAASEDTTKATYDCPPGADLVFYRTPDGGHQWPGSATSAMLEPVIGRTTMSIDATRLIWDFVSRHQLP